MQKKIILIFVTLTLFLINFTSAINLKQQNASMVVEPPQRPPVKPPQPDQPLTNETTSIFNVNDPNDDIDKIDELNRTITLNCRVESSLPTDAIKILLNVNNRNSTVAEALAAKSDLNKTLIDILQANNSDGDYFINFTSQDVTPNYNRNYVSSSNTTYNFLGFNTAYDVEIILNDANKAAAVINGLNDNNYMISDVSFVISDKAKRQAEAALFKDCVANAQRNANSLISGLGYNIQGIESITVIEQPSYYNSAPILMPLRNAMAVSASIVFDIGKN
jgi:uncharacterized protein YggE